MKGFHTHEFEGQIWYMPCKYHEKEEMKRGSCWDGYEQKGFKMKEW